MELKGNASQWFGEISKMRYKRSPKQKFDRIRYAMVKVIPKHENTW